jgi:hypothetical protein
MANKKTFFHEYYESMGKDFSKISLSFSKEVKSQVNLII